MQITQVVLLPTELFRVAEESGTPIISVTDIKERLLGLSYHHTAYIAYLSSQMVDHQSVPGITPLLDSKWLATVDPRVKAELKLHTLNNVSTDIPEMPILLNKSFVDGPTLIICDFIDSDNSLQASTLANLRHITSTFENNQLSAVNSAYLHYKMRYLSTLARP